MVFEAEHHHDKPTSCLDDERPFTESILVHDLTSQRLLRFECSRQTASFTTSCFRFQGVKPTLFRNTPKQH